MPGGATTERQFSNSTSTPRSRSVGASTPGRRSALEIGEHAQRAGVDLRRELREPVDADRHLAAEDRRERFAAAREADVVDAPRLDADGGRDEPRENLVAAADRAAAPRDRLGALAGTRRASRRACANGDASRHGERLVLAGEARDRHGVGERDRRIVGHDAAEHDEPGDEQRVAVAALGADEAREADRAGGAGDVLDDGRRHDAGALQHLLHGARRLIPAAARRRRRDDAQLLELRLAQRGRRREIVTSASTAAQSTFERDANPLRLPRTLYRVLERFGGLALQ